MWFVCLQFCTSWEINNTRIHRIICWRTIRLQIMWVRADLYRGCTIGVILVNYIWNYVWKRDFTVYQSQLSWQGLKMELEVSPIQACLREETWFIRFRGKHSWRGGSMHGMKIKMEWHCQVMSAPRGGWVQKRCEFWESWPVLKYLQVLKSVITNIAGLTLDYCETMVATGGPAVEFSLSSLTSGLELEVAHYGYWSLKLRCLKADWNLHPSLLQGREFWHHAQETEQPNVKAVTRACHLLMVAV